MYGSGIEHPIMIKPKLNMTPAHASNLIKHAAIMKRTKQKRKKLQGLLDEVFLKPTSTSVETLPNNLENNNNVCEVIENNIVKVRNPRA